MRARLISIEYLRFFLGGTASGRDEAEFNEISIASPQKREAILNINQRIYRLNKRSDFIIVAIVSSIIAAVIVIIFAGRLTSLDASAIGAVDRLGSALLSLEDKVSSASRDRDSEIFKYNQEKQKLGVQDLPKDSSLSVSVMIANRKYEKLESMLGSYQDLYAFAWKKDIESEKGYNDDRYILATAITRFGVVIILVFLTQILIGLYRYNMRLIAFYQSRKDFIYMWDGSIKTMSKFSAIVTPIGVDFGKEPKNPFGGVLDAAANGLAKNRPTITASDDSGGGRQKSASHNKNKNDNR